MTIEEEIAELEREAAEPLLSEERRYTCRLTIALLRRGFRTRLAPGDARLIEIVHIQTDHVIETLSVSELRFRALYGL